MKVIIDGYGEPTEFDSIEDAQAELRSIGPEWTGVTLELASDLIDIRNEGNESVGHVKKEGGQRSAD